MHQEHKDLILKVTMALDGCEGILIPYPTAKKMAQVSKELKGYLEQVERGNEEDED